MKKPALRFAVLASIGATAIALVGPMALAGASINASKPSTSVLVPAAYAKSAGFTKVVNAPSSTTDTSVTGCPDGAQAEYSTASGAPALLSEVLYCVTTKDAATLLHSVTASGAAPTGISPPKGLGTGAVERVGANSSYLIAWRRGNAFELTGLSTGAASATGTTTATPTPITASEQQELQHAALEQNGRYASLTVSSHKSGSSSANAKAQTAANTASVAAGCPKSPATALKKTKWTSAPAQTIDPTKSYRATIKTDVGTFVIALDSKDAPKTVNNFVFLAQHHYYDCVIFHRVIPGFVDQTGDPTGTGSGGPGYTIPDELPAKASNPANQYPLGSVAMANTGQPNTGGSQWFIVDGAEGETLPNSYTLFGQVVSGMSVVNKINAQGSSSGVPPNVTHRMLKVTITSS